MGHMQQGEVNVSRVDDDGSTGLALGQAVLVDPTVAIMRLENRDSTPTLPLRVLVPAAAGGGRDEHATPVDVAEVHPADDRSPHAVLILAEPVPTGAHRQLGGAQPLVGTSTAGAATTLGAGGGTNGTPWWCKVWPPACR